MKVSAATVMAEKRATETNVASIFASELRVRGRVRRRRMGGIKGKGNEEEARWGREKIKHMLRPPSRQPPFCTSATGYAPYGNSRGFQPPTSHTANTLLESDDILFNFDFAT